jgi:sugar lactone lactonase YvrE
LLLTLALGMSSIAHAQLPTPIATVSGFSGPEAVRYDADQDRYFVANFNGRGDAADNNGFISRVQPDGTIESLHFIMGGSRGATLHAPRGMFITGDTLWVADVDAVRGFNRRTGAPVATVDFTALQPGFLNDVAAGPDGVLYVTDTGRNRIYRIAGRTATVALGDTALNRPNGITWDAEQSRFIVVPYGGKQLHFGWRAGQPTFTATATLLGGRYDGVELLSVGRLLVASQADSSLHAIHRGQVQRVTRTSGAPADIGVDTRRKRVAVPYIALNRVEIFQLPRGW